PRHLHSFPTRRSSDLYHYGLTPQMLAAVRLIPGTRAAVDLTFRDYYVSPYASNKRGGSENIARADAWLSIRLAPHHAASVRYLRSEEHTSELQSLRHL